MANLKAIKKRIGSVKNTHRSRLFTASRRSNDCVGTIGSFGFARSSRLRGK